MGKPARVTKRKRRHADGGMELFSAKLKRLKPNTDYRFHVASVNDVDKVVQQSEAIRCNPKTNTFQYNAIVTKTSRQLREQLIPQLNQKPETKWGRIIKPQLNADNWKLS